MRETEQYLIDVAYPYWEAEARIAKRFFAGKPTREQHIHWLKAQLWKELHPVDGYFTGLHRELANLVDMFPEVDRTVDRHHYHGLMEQLVQEFNHYVLMADILEYLLGRKMDAGDTVQLSEEKALGDLRRKFVAGSAVEKAAVLVTEGGGARLFPGRPPPQGQRPRAQDRRGHGRRLRGREKPLPGGGAGGRRRRRKQTRPQGHETGHRSGKPAARAHAKRDVPVPALAGGHQAVSGEAPPAGLTL